MRLNAESLVIDPESVAERIVKFLRARLSESKQKGFVFGMSGGLDSSTVAGLCAKTLRASDNLALIMPHTESAKEDKEHALLVAEKFKIPYRIIDITGAVHAVQENMFQLDSESTVHSKEPMLRNAVGNIKARIRMINLYLAANTTDRLVVGSSDKSELLVGYYTKYGDGGTDILPIADLYKTQVRSLASHLGVPEVVIMKPSSPGLWKDQTAEKEIGMEYEQLDLILYGLERFMRPKEIADELGLSVGIVNDVINRITNAEHKRRGGIVFKIGYRTPTLDWRIPL
ncbi:MAG: NAD+ synthase [Candidatus Atabeyarchaeum deiterrae]